MIDFRVGGREVVLTYEPEFGSAAWVWDRLTDDGEVTVSRVFHFERRDLIQEPKRQERSDLEGWEWRFRFAKAVAGYFRVDGRKLGIENDVLLPLTGIDWSRKLFAAHRDVSIFRRLTKVIEAGEEIVIGGERENAIPVEVFEEMIGKFPNSGELNRYANARVATIIGDYIQPQRDFRANYEKYLDRRASRGKDDALQAPELVTTEIEKFELLRDTIVDWLAKGDRSEEQWQKQILAVLQLIFPKYIAVIEKLPIEDRYSDQSRTIKREIDIALVDVNGNIDVVEIKKPMDDKLLRKTKYRDNYVPTSELSGTIMQAEKYLFHLAKGGQKAEDALTKKYQDALPDGVAVRITNPKAILILGRDMKSDGSSALTDQQLFDLEVVKRKYANMIDIISYDDLLRRLENIISSLQRRKSLGLNFSNS